MAGMPNAREIKCGCRRTFRRVSDYDYTVRSGDRCRVFIHGINYAPETSGVGRNTGEFAEYLAERGHSPHNIEHALVLAIGSLGMNCG